MRLERVAFRSLSRRTLVASALAGLLCIGVAQTALAQEETTFASEPAGLEVWIIEADWCAWCAIWEREIGVVYDRTAFAERAPLRRLDIADQPPSGVVFSEAPTVTPTFIVTHDGVETGRFLGFSGDQFWWAQLDQLLTLAQPDDGG